MARLRLDSLLDQTNYRKSVDQVLHLLHALDSDVHFVVTDKPRHTRRRGSAV
ncbi:MAG TPA: hypothetical protein VNU46_06450 [Gemmatimonadaceae bacterium]|nr:hypothetical protein [Gemmatimonadaceae bacterium]